LRQNSGIWSDNNLDRNQPTEKFKTGTIEIERGNNKKEKRKVWRKT
jgi:hypothetical protein